jgi:phospholipid/cholesterol/gamma-HCH transport system substrate-binding protein
VDNKVEGKVDRRIIDFWVGLFVLIGFCSLLVLALKIGNLGVGASSATYTVNAKFNNVGGLKIRAPVRASGVTVGRVTGISFDNSTYQAMVTMAIDAAYRFPLDTSASVLTSGVLGENYIGLDAGAEEDYLAGGDHIDITQSAVVLERVIGRFLYDKAQDTGE